MLTWATLAVLFILLLSAVLSDDQPWWAAEGYNGMVASDDERCSKIGRDFLEIGGHAIDAIVAVTFCEGVVRPQTSGIGGGGFILMKPADEDGLVIDMREFAPGTASEDMYHENTTMKFTGIHSIAVPAQVKGLYEAWKMYGRIPWKFLVLPAENYALDGFTISENLYEMMAIPEVNNSITSDPGLKSVFAPNGTLLNAGEVCKNVKLADTLKTIGYYGSDVYYNGPIGEALVADIQKAGGNITMDDLKKYQIKFRKPITSKLLDHNLIGVPPPASGSASMFLALNIILNRSPLFLSTSDERVLETHRRIEAMKHAFAVRMNLGDPEFVDITEVLHDMLSLDFAKSLRIDDSTTFDPTHYGGKWNLWNQTLQHGTTHFCVVDKDRNAVSVTTTVNWYFGSGFLSPSTGIILNNHMDDFSMPLNCTSLNCTSTDATCPCKPDIVNATDCTCCDLFPPAKANFIRPYKRPLSASTPVIILDKKNEFKGVIGASGGPRIIGAVTEIFLNYFVDRMNASASVRTPRYYHTLIPNAVDYENYVSSGLTFEVPEIIVDGLRHKGHKVEKMEGEPGISQFIVRKINATGAVLVGVSDPRYGGKPAGY